MSSNETTSYNHLKEEIRDPLKQINLRLSSSNPGGSFTLWQNDSGILYVGNNPLGGGGGGVSGPVASTDGHLASFDGVDGNTLKDSGILLNSNSAFENTSGINLIPSISNPGISSPVNTLWTKGDKGLRFGDRIVYSGEHITLTSDLYAYNTVGIVDPSSVGSLNIEGFLIHEGEGVSANGFVALHINQFFSPLVPTTTTYLAAELALPSQFRPATTMVFPIQVLIGGNPQKFPGRLEITPLGVLTWHAEIGNEATAFVDLTSVGGSPTEPIIFPAVEWGAGVADGFFSHGVNYSV